MQNMQRYFGFKVTINDDLDPADEAILRAQADKIVDMENLDLDRYNVYLHQLILSSEDTHFGIHGGIPGRLKKLNIEFHVNQKQRKSRDIQFFNHVIKTGIPETVRPFFSPTYIGYEIPADYFSEKAWFQNAIIAFVRRELRIDRRKIKVQVTATPTLEFSSVLKDRSKADASTQLDLRFRRDVQLQLPLLNRVNLRGETMSDEKTVKIFNNYGTANVFGEVGSARDIIFDSATLVDLRKLREAALEEGANEEASHISAAVEAASEGKKIKAIDHLRSAGTWAMQAANKLGLVAAETAVKAAINSQIGG